MRIRIERFLAMSLFVLCFSGCTVMEQAMVAGKSISCDKLNDEAFLQKIENNLVAQTKVGFRAGVAMAKEKLECAR